VAARKKNCRRQRAWLVFFDESGITDRPPVRRTWAPKGKTPVVVTPYRWKKMSVAAGLAYRWDGRRTRLLFQTKDGSYTSRSLITFLRTLKRHFRGQRVILIWDRLNAHRKRGDELIRRQAASVAEDRVASTLWPDLNPVEQLWGNVKGHELANLAAEDVFDMACELRRGMSRVRRSDLAHSFLAHAGLFL
jgi:transposase